MSVHMNTYVHIFLCNNPVFENKDLAPLYQFVLPIMPYATMHENYYQALYRWKKYRL
jgi:hypothetical protein